MYIISAQGALINLRSKLQRPGDLNPGPEFLIHIPACHTLIVLVEETQALHMYI